jgi:hypothetical protein
MMHTLWTCLRHPRSWRQCFADEGRERSIVQSWDAEGKAAVENAYVTKRELQEMKRQWANDPITSAVKGQRRQRL